MKDFPQKQLLINYLLGICTNREREEIEQWLDDNQENVSLLQQVASELGKNEPFPLPRKAEVKKEVLQQISNPALAGFRSKTSFQKTMKFWLKLAAVFLVVSVAGAISVYLGHNEEAEIREGLNMKQSTMSYGQTATLQFGDGSVIQMNSGSTLRYPETFGPDKREVYLEGEAFFKITPDESRPFIVHAGNTSTRVLGTSFNIKAYENDDEIQVAVAEGQVAVSQSGSGNHADRSEEDIILLKKNQWLTFRPAGRITEKGEGDIYEMIAWKDRVLVFSNKTFNQAARMLERWYGVEILLEDPDLKSQILEGEHRDVSLREVLNSLQLAMNFKYDFEENRVRIY